MANLKSSGLVRAWLRKTLTVTGWMTLFLVTGIGIGRAASGYAESTYLSIKMENKTVKDVFHAIEKNSEYVFFYYDGILDVTRKVSIHAKNQTVDRILDLLFAETENAYVINDRQIFITHKEVAVHKGVERVQQQGKTISGTVTDNMQEPLAGVNIQVKGTTTGTVTDADGKFSFTVMHPDPTLVVSYIGYKTQEIKVGSQQTLRIDLLVDELGLEEVVVVGYGIQKKSDLTGSIVSVKADDIKNIPAKSIAESLQGKVAGVMINKGSGKPGSTSEIIIRGVGSINGLDPLFIIDGIDRGNNVNYNPKDVESIEIIKDASAAAIYGARAAGGVVLITTKKGSYDQKTQIDFNVNSGLRKIARHYKYLGTQDMIPAQRAIGVDFSQWNDINSLPDTNWFDEVFQDGMEQSYIFSLRGGSEKLNYYLSLGYENEQGLQDRNDWGRYSIRVNSDYRLHRKFTVGTRIYLAKVDEHPYTTGEMAWRTIPYMAIRNEDGSWAEVPKWSPSDGSNSVADLAFHRFENQRGIVNADLYADWQIMDGLTLNVTGSAAYESFYKDEWVSEDMLKKAGNPNSYYKESSVMNLYTLQATLTYAKVFAKKHDVKLLAGYEARGGKSFGLSSTATAFPMDGPYSFSLSANVNKMANGTLNIEYGRFLSQFARLNYSFDNRYLLTANVRRDGSPKFGSANRWGVFPSVSAGWKLSEEAFFKNAAINWVTMIKPRVSWGILGNDMALENYSYLPAFKTVNLHSFNETSSIFGYNSVKVTNPKIKWEEIHTIDGGVDFSFLSNRLTASFDYYNRNTRDMIYNLSTPWSAGIGENNQAANSMPVNIGKISNKGWELTFSYRDEINGVRYGIGGNLSHNVNEVVDIGLSTAAIYSGDGWPNNTAGGNQPFKTVNGMPIGQIYGLKTDGLITSQEEIDELNRMAREKYRERNPGASDAAVNDIYYSKRLTTIGDLKFADLNGDGIIDNSDRTFIGNPWPKYQYGFNLYAGWKGIDVVADFVGLAGVDVLNANITMERNFQQDYNTTGKIFEASYFMGNGLTEHPRVSTVDPLSGGIVRDPNNNYTQYSDYLVENGSYLKLKNLTIGYSLPKSWLSKWKISNLRIYVTGNNLFTVTKFTGLDPEFVPDNSEKTKQHSYYTRDRYPQTKLYSIGLDINL
jgi:TonB-linked SusC/RagA family outer membrane protein